ncbi:MAG: hypothetical protein M3425_02910 [Actinomycetota bacterium]|nr:hypothetical protein [Actinomycetota bacterium]MDQ3528890.1 hypothetical protein [Actinomycetota bacterium]
MSRERDRTTVRRALRAGALAGGVVACALLLAVLLGPGGGAPAAVMAGIAVGALVAAGWLLLGAVLDIFAGERVGATRWAWTAVTTVLALLGPFLVVGVLARSA